jgi:hypothetical protein
MVYICSVCKTALSRPFEKSPCCSAEVVAVLGRGDKLANSKGKEKVTSPKQKTDKKSKKR